MNSKTSSLQAELKIAAENFSIKKINFNKNKISISYKNEELNTSLFNDDKLEDKVKMTMDVIQAINQNAS